ncbi:MAG: sugar transporter [Lysobacteraceae bacterium]|nr:MAG: sugar transporter [Xanthomonadaceae bacterium]
MVTVTATATRNQRDQSEVPVTVSVIDREELDRRLVRDIKDLVRYEPGVSVTTSFGRFGLGGFRIRGLGGNRVLVQTDGIAVSDAFSIGSFSNANRNFVDLDTLKAVEIVRGPASALYGSDALGGVVSFVTKDPEDYLGGDGEGHGEVKLGYQGDTGGLFAGSTAAWAGERWSGLVTVGSRKGREVANMGDRGGVGAARTRPNPQDSRGASLLAKMVFDPSAEHRLRIVLEGNEDRVDTSVLTAVSALTDALDGADRQARARFSLQHEWWAPGVPFIDSLEWQIYLQDSQTIQDTLEARSNGTLRQRRFDFDQRLQGLELVARRTLQRGRVDHDLTWGLELTRTEVGEKRDGLAIDPATGITTPVLPPDVFPVRDFPLSTVTGAALFLQDEIRFDDGRLRLVPGLRVDRFELEPRPDAIFEEDNPGVAIAGLSDTALSPKLGLVRELGRGWSLYAGYAHGFRAPPYSDVNLGFTNLAFGYTAIPNPDLKPETSRGYELGLRRRGEHGWMQLAGYRNDYDDFIESLAFVGVNEQGLLVFQSRNLSRARIVGAEFKAGLDLAMLSRLLQGWSLRAAASWQRGDDRTRGEPLRSVDPPRAVLGLAYEAEGWGFELVGNLAARKDRVAALSSGATAFAPPGYGVLDGLLHWTFAPGARLDIGLFNLADRRYWDWADVPGVAADSPVLDRYTRPGRHAALSLRLQW